MIRVRDYIDRIAEECFDDELKQMLETTIGGRPVTIKDQMRYHWRHACYPGTEEELYVDIRYQMHNNWDRILRIKDFYQNVGHIMDVRGYQQVKLNVDEEMSTEGKVSNSATANRTTNKTAGNISNLEQQFNSSTSANSAGASQTNELHNLVDVIKPAQVSKKSVQINKAALAGDQLTQTPENLEVDNLLPLEDGNPVRYQNFTKDLTIDQNNVTNVVNNSSTNDTLSNNNTTMTTTRTTGTKTDSSKREIKYVDNEARIKAWTTELPRLKQRFWNIFFGLFRYEHL